MLLKRKFGLGPLSNMWKCPKACRLSERIFDLNVKCIRVVRVSFGVIRSEDGHRRPL